MPGEDNGLDAVERIIGSAQRMVASHLDLLRIEVVADANAVLRRIGTSILGAAFLLVAWGALVCAVSVVLEPFVSLASRFAGVAALHGVIGAVLLRSRKQAASTPRRARDVAGPAAGEASRSEAVGAATPHPAGPPPGEAPEHHQAPSREAPEHHQAPSREAPDNRQATRPPAGTGRGEDEERSSREERDR